MPDPLPMPSSLASDSGPRSWVVFLASTALFAAVLLYHNAYLLREPIYEESDSAANSLLVLKAKRLELLHGHYSRFGFYHPGPGLLYVEAAGEWLLYDQLKVVPAPHNGQIFALLLMHAALVGIAVTCVTGATGSARLGAAVSAAFLIYFAREAQLGSHWFANVFMLVYLPFQVSAGAVASGRTNSLGWMALTGSLAVHSHICFVAFVVPISLYALFRVWRAGEYRLRTLPPAERRAWWTFAAVIALFVLPIAIHTTLHYPGEVGRYLSYTRPPSAERTVGEVSTFLVRCATNESDVGWPLFLGVVACGALAAATFPAPGRSFARQLAVVAVLTSAVMTYYAARSVDDYKLTYVGRFFGSVVLIGWALVAMRVAALARSALARGLLGAAALAVCAWAAYTGSFNNGYRGSPESVALAEEIAADPRWADGDPAVTIQIDKEAWVEAAALVLQLERRGKRVWLVERGRDILFTDRFRPDGRPVNARWHIDVVEPSEPRVGVRRVLAEYRGTSFRERETRVPLGAIALSSGGRALGAKPVSGWYSAPHLDYLIPAARESSLLIDLESCPTPHVRLTLSGVVIGRIVPEVGGQRVGVVVNGEPVGEVTFASIKDAEERSVVFPSGVLNRELPARIEFTFPDAAPYKTRFAPRPPVLYSIQVRGLTLAPVP